MNSIGVDLFDAEGKKWLAVVCQYSGYAWLSHLCKTTSQHILETLNNLFLEYGFPSNIRSDRGPQFHSEFADYCKNKNIKHELSSPYNPESNGLAEAAVKNLKALIIRCGEDLKQAIATWRNMVRTDGSSPAQLFFGRTQKQNLPSLNPNAKAFCPNSLIKKRDKLHQQRIHSRDQHSIIINDLVPGQKLLIQDYITGLCSKSAVVIEKREDCRSYWVKDDRGRLFIRGRRHLKDISSSVNSDKETSANLISISRLSIEMNTSAGLKVKLHKLAESVTRAALINPIPIEEEHWIRNTSVFVFYIPEHLHPATCHSTDRVHFDNPKGLESKITHYLISSEEYYSLKANGISP